MENLWRRWVVDKVFIHTKWNCMHFVSLLHGKSIENFFKKIFQYISCKNEILHSAEVWQQWDKSAGSRLAHGLFSICKAAQTEWSQAGWKCVKMVRGVWCGLFWSGSGLTAGWRCWGARGVLIGGKWHDAQSQQRIIYLTHLQKLLKRLMHQAIWKSLESPSTEAKLSHLVLLSYPHHESYVRYD